MRDAKQPYYSEKHQAWVLPDGMSGKQWKQWIDDNSDAVKQESGELHETCDGVLRLVDIGNGLLRNPENGHCYEKALCPVVKRSTPKKRLSVNYIPKLVLTVHYWTKTDDKVESSAPSGREKVKFYSNISPDEAERKILNRTKFKRHDGSSRVYCVTL